MKPKKFDFIVVGTGLAGVAVTRELQARDKSFVVFDNRSQNSSYVAGGIFNPVILKRFTPAWKAAQQLEIALLFYKSLEMELDTPFVYHWDIYRRFYSIEEQNDWFIAADHPSLTKFLDPALVKNTNPAVETSFGFGRVMHTGNIDTVVMLNAYRSYLEDKKRLINQEFDYDLLKHSKDGVVYNDITAKHIIFCEGFGINTNPYFNYIPLNGNKGEYIIINAPKLQLEFAIKASVFIMPLGNNLYKVGATYNNEDKTAKPSLEAREQLEASLKQVINVDYEVIDQMAGVRPTTGDRRPVAGRHPEYDNIYCLNGFGSRGVLIAPYLAPKLIDFILNDEGLEVEVDIERFKKRYYRKN